MLFALAAAVFSALAFGASDFFGGIGAGRLGVARGTLLTFALATAVALIALPIAGGAFSGSALRWGLLAGVFEIAGMLAFYAALVAGPISLGAPLAGLADSAVPVIAAVALGQALSGLHWLGVGAALLSGILVSFRKEEGAGLSVRALVLAIVGGVLLGALILSLDAAPSDSGLWPVAVAMVTGLAIIGVLVALGRVSRPVAKMMKALDAAPNDPLLEADEARLVPWPAASRLRRGLPSAAAGVLMGGANLTLLLALRGGPLAVVSVVANLYPVGTVLLAWLVARERLTAVQLTGVGLAIAASVLFAIG
ncbi:MAG: DMT family transporter [Microbacteriaceae bacterium]|nr:DMT family transporter [Microbacteriaceae bacterium]